MTQRKEHRFQDDENRFMSLDPEDFGLPSFIKIRSFPDTTQDYLRYQIGEMATRPELAPIFDAQNRAVGCKKTNRLASVFHLQAWGESMDHAKTMFFARFSTATTKGE